MSSVIKNIFLAIPFYFLWNFLAPIYLIELPAVYQNLPFWHIVGVFTLVSILRSAIFPKKKNTMAFKWKNFNFNNPRNSHPRYSADDNYTNIKDVTPNKQ